MKPGSAFFLLSLILAGQTPAWCQLAKPAAIAPTNLTVSKAARIPSQTISGLEKGFNQLLTEMAPDPNEAVELLGDTRGVQLEDYGVVFTTEVSLTTAPGTSPFRQTIPPEMAAHVRKVRLERMPMLKIAMTQMMRNMATTFNQIPSSQQLVLVVRLYYAPWENTSGMPAQVIMKADRASAAAGRVLTEER